MPGSCSNDKGTMHFFGKCVNMILIAQSDQFLQLELSHSAFPTATMITYVYASCNGRKRRTLWSDLSSMSLNIPWIVVGDFNIVTCQEEKMGGCAINLNDAAELVQMIQQSSLTDLGYNRSKYSWSNNSLRGVAIAERLDRVMGNNELIAHVFFQGGASG